MLAPVRSRCRPGYAVGWDGAGDFWVSLLWSFGVSEGGTLGRVLGAGALRDRACARRQARGEGRLSRCARGGWVFAYNARSGPVPLPPGVCGWVVTEWGGL